MNRFSRRKFVAFSGWRRLLMAAIVVAAIPASAWAQAAAQYDELPPFKKDGTREITTWSQVNVAMGDEKKAVEGMLAGAAMDQAKFETFFNDVVFPLFTMKKNFGDKNYPPAKIRLAFKKDFIGKATSRAAKEKVIDLTLAKMEQIANGNYLPWARANAVLMIAELNESEPGPPAKKAMPILLKWSADRTTPDIVRAPAIRGLERHAAAQGGIDPAQRPAVTKAMLDIVKQHTAAADQSLEGHEWIMRRAIDVLAALGEPGENGTVYGELVKVVEDEAAPRPARGTAAAALAKVRFTPPKDYDAEGLVKTLGKFAVTTYKAEAAEAASKRQLIVPRRIKQQLGEVRTALVGVDGKSSLIAMFSAEPQKKFVTDLVAQIDALMKICDKEPELPPDPATAASDPNYVPGVPFDTQKTLKKELTDFGGALEAVLQAGVGGNPAPPAAVPGDVPLDIPAKPAPVSTPAGIPGF
jgi:hypothetical protein